MSNILDYMDWRGDLTFEQSPFCQLDSLIFAQLVYVDLGEIVSSGGPGEGIPLEEASRRFFETHDEEEILKKVSAVKNYMYVLKKAATCCRYRDTLLYGYRREIDAAAYSQFTVMKYVVGDGSHYVAFCGTDDTLVAWREDFNLSFLDATPGQKKAVEYLGELNLDQVKVLRLGGHSKGGNLAIYGAMHGGSTLQEKLVCVDNFDGPGFRQQVVESPEFDAILPVIHTVIPKSSIVGRLFEMKGKIQVVESSAFSVAQHDPMSWQVLGTGFVDAGQVDSSSVIVDETMNKWLDQMDMPTRRHVINAGFDLLDAAHIETIDDFFNLSFAQIRDVFRAQKEMTEDERRLLGHALVRLWKSGQKSLVDNVIRGNGNRKR